jgi:serine/threonine protein phosphatase PrpC
MGLATTYEKFLNVAMDSIHSFVIDELEVALYTTPGSRKGKTKNEDSCGYIYQGKDQAVLIVSDGMGGHKMGDKASRIAINTLVGRPTQRKRHLKSNNIRQRIERSHFKIMDLGVEAGATLVCAQIAGNTARFFSVGDSVGLLINKKSEILYKTIEHSVIGFATQAGLMTQKEADQQNHSNEILNCLGFYDSRIELSFELNFNTEDSIFLCSDGVTDLLNVQKMSQLLSGKTALESAQNILNETNRLKEGLHDYDDLTFILAKKRL